MRTKIALASLGLLIILFSCNNDEIENGVINKDQEIIDKVLNIDISNLSNYANQYVPSYITKDNTPTNNPITDVGATLGRVLFYDTNLSSNKTVSCSSCHKQSNAFSDLDQQSTGVNDLTPRHSMRLINSRFSQEAKFFWDERAASLEDQTTIPIRDHGEMGFSGANGDPNFDDLLIRLQELEYYPVLFRMAFGSEVVTEANIQKALGQFIRSIQSFDSKYDAGREQVINNNVPFPNFTPSENMGKRLFMAPPQFDGTGNRIGGGAGCGGCHKAPEFDIKPNSGNNGVVKNTLGELDLDVTKSPTIRDVVNGQGIANGPFMQEGVLLELEGVLDHYNVMAANPKLDTTLAPGGNPQRLHLTELEKAQIIDFIETLSGSNVYTDEKWSNPFK